MSGQRISVEEAAPILGMTPNYIRYLMRTKRLPIGEAVKNSTGTGYRYLIYRPLVEKFTGQAPE